MSIITITSALKKNFRGLVVFVVATLIFLTTSGSVVGYYLPITKPSAPFINVYIPSPVMEAVSYLNHNIPLYSHVLSTFYTGMYLPSFTDTVVYVGNERATNQFYEKYQFSEQFFRGTMLLSDVPRFLEDNDITYVFWDVGESPIRYQTYLTPIFQNSMVTLFRVDLGNKGK
jgi:hypothetical protein